MHIMGDATKVTIYIGESDRWGNKPLYLAILELLKAEDCAGATVTRGVAGFGRHSRIRSAGIVALSQDLPLVIEWVDAPARVERMMPRLVEMVAEGLITCQPVEVIAYSHRELRALPAQAPVTEIMTRDVQTVSPQTPVREALQLLVRGRFRALPVVDEERRPVGILTDGDLLAQLDLPSAGVQRELTQDELAGELGRVAANSVVGAVMARDPLVIQEETRVRDAVRLMAERKVKRLPVVDRGGRLVGMVSRLDVLGALAQPPVTEHAGAVPPPRPGQAKIVRDVMNADALAVRNDASLAAVIDILVSTGGRRVVVVDALGRVAGIITDGDILAGSRGAERAGLLALLLRGETQRLPASALATFSHRTAEEFMTHNPVTVRPETALLDALHLLLKHRIKRLPVVDEAGQLVGLVGREDVLAALAADLHG